ncbi:MAG: hypothetical protein UY28_C0004G0049 [Candidatus Amesbacteria bacterium GW2011_GWB1_48_13]|uniref:Uncharacterized protein n=1 Tax=Candidatus Amesbacteria bacterium GW2011_GWB1_48_13 TaxID=1618362 RepID=A0A0G1UW78_9BACT|nr:MAG: hypothetical protein UY28_C0004G0049 [Candidatus Amesbacteria bacterium GW2011_GWB1_48_13]
MAFPWTIDRDNLTQCFEYTASGDVLYWGLAQPGSLKNKPQWQILKYIYSQPKQTSDIQWADGDSEFNNVWDNRATLNYS